MEEIVSVTKKGQTTIPKALREKHRIGKKALAVDTKEGILLKAAPDPMMEKGSLQDLFRSRTSKQLIEDARSAEIKKEKKLLRYNKINYRMPESIAFNL